MLYCHVYVGVCVGVTELNYFLYFKFVGSLTIMFRRCRKKNYRFLLKSTDYLVTSKCRRRN